MSWNTPLMSLQELLKAGTCQDSEMLSVWRMYGRYQALVVYPKVSKCMQCSDHNLTYLLYPLENSCLQSKQLSFPSLVLKRSSNPASRLCTSSFVSCISCSSDMMSCTSSSFLSAISTYYSFNYSSL